MHFIAVYYLFPLGVAAICCYALSRARTTMPEINKPQDTRQAAAQVGAQVDEATRRGAEAAQQGGRAAADAVRQGADVTADLARQGTQAGVEAVRRNAEVVTETARRSVQAVAEGQRRIAQDAAQTFEQVSHRIAEAARGTSEDVSRLFVLPQAAEGGLRDAQQAVAGLVEGVVQTNLRATQELLRLTNPAGVVELQQRFVREYLDALVQGTATLVHAVRRTADETLRPLEEQVQQRQAQGQQGGQQGQQQAAE